MSKAGNLTILKSYRINIPLFYVLESSEYNKENLCKWLNRYDDSTLFAVRSSCNVEDGNTYSYAGLFDTYLYIPKKHLNKYIEMCFDSINNERVSDYMKKNKLHEEIVVNVIIQEMIDSEVSGVLFSKNPLTHEEEFYIECGYGIGEGIVSGEISPDIIRVNPDRQKIILYEIGFQKYKIGRNTSSNGVEKKKVNELNQSKKKLTNRNLKRLIKTVQKIKKIFPFDLDVEFGILKNKVYILQVRPMTI